MCVHVGPSSSRQCHVRTLPTTHTAQGDRIRFGDDILLSPVTSGSSSMNYYVHVSDIPVDDCNRKLHPYAEMAFEVPHNKLATSLHP